MEKINFSVHVCVARPDGEALEVYGPDAGWLAVTFPDDIRDAMVDSWFGFEENCSHGYCARVDFNAGNPRAIIDELAKVEGVDEVSAQDPHNPTEPYWCPCENCGIGPFDNRDEPGDSLNVCNDCLRKEDEERELQDREHNE